LAVPSDAKDQSNYDSEDSDDESWVNPDEDRMSPEQEERWYAELEAWPNKLDSDSESDWDSEFDPIDQYELWQSVLS